MFRFFALLTFVATALATSPYDEFYGRIVGGHDVPIEQFPYQVSLQTNSGGHFCGGSIIDKDTIVTAAHCMQKYTASQFKVRLGSSDYKKGGELVSVKSFKYHEGYNSDLMINDVAVIKLATPVKESSTVQYIKLAETAPDTKTEAVVSGWGTTCYLVCGVSPVLKAVDVLIVKQEDCSSDVFGYGSEVAETMICAYGVKADACQGDSGGPLAAEGKLAGVVSWGYGCAREGFPGVYANVADFVDWIWLTSAALDA